MALWRDWDAALKRDVAEETGRTGGRPEIKDGPDSGVCAKNQQAHLSQNPATFLSTDDSRGKGNATRRSIRGVHWRRPSPALSFFSFLTIPRVLLLGSFFSLFLTHTLSHLPHLPHCRLWGRSSLLLFYFILFPCGGYATTGDSAVFSE
ncbi:hypothetical protein F4804DRAFT_75179 [Jackrogersella minutella]|nr:hypothetical protein F4804DRAFT_75179 [Jackrogersella minutella]